MHPSVLALLRFFAALAEASAYSVYTDEHGTEMIDRIKAVE